MDTPITPFDRRFQPTSDVTLDFRSEKLRQLHAYWDSKRAGRAMPQRADIEPTEIPLLLPHIGLVDVESAPPRMYFRLIGTHITHALGRDNTNKYFDEAYQEPLLGDVTRVYRMVVDLSVPVRHFGKAQFSDKQYREYESVHLPLSQNGAAVSMILVGQEYFL